MADDTLLNDDDMELDSESTEETRDITEAQEDDASEITEEKRSVRESTDDEMPHGLGNTDPGIEADDWEARELQSGIEGNEDEDDELIGFSIEDGSSQGNTIDAFGDNSDI